MSILSDTENAVVDTIKMRLSLNEAVQYLKDLGYEMHKREILNEIKINSVAYAG